MWRSLNKGPNAKSSNYRGSVQTCCFRPVLLSVEGLWTCNSLSVFTSSFEITLICSIPESGLINFERSEEPDEEIESTTGRQGSCQTNEVNGSRV